MESYSDIKILTPFTLTAAAVSFTLISAQPDYIPLDHTVGIEQVVDNIYLQSLDQKAYNQLLIIQTFAEKLTKESQDLPKEVAEVINENFFELL